VTIFDGWREIAFGPHRSILLYVRMRAERDDKARRKKRQEQKGNTTKKQREMKK